MNCMAMHGRPTRPPVQPAWAVRSHHIHRPAVYRSQLTRAKSSPAASMPGTKSSQGRMFKGLRVPIWMSKLANDARDTCSKVIETVTFKRLRLEVQHVLVDDRCADLKAQLTTALEELARAEVEKASARAIYDRVDPGVRKLDEEEARYKKANHASECQLVDQQTMVIAQQEALGEKQAAAVREVIAASREFTRQVQHKQQQHERAMRKTEAGIQVKVAAAVAPVTAEYEAKAEVICASNAATQQQQAEAAAAADASRAAFKAAMAAELAQLQALQQQGRTLLRVLKPLKAALATVEANLKTLKRPSTAWLAQLRERVAHARTNAAARELQHKAKALTVSWKV